MGLCIELQSETGEVVQRLEDAHNLLHQLLPSQNASPLLSGIDWYADTTFNSRQMTRFLLEWQALMSAELSQSEQSLLTQIKQLAIKCRDDVHLYLKFIGD